MKKSTIYAGLKACFYSKNYQRILHLLAGIGVVLFFLQSCSPIKRHAKLVEKYPFVHTQDSVIIRDTIRVTVPKISIDTVVKISSLRDTLIIQKDRLKIKMWTIHDSIFVSGQCDTVFIEKIVTRKIPIRYYQSKVERSWLKYLIVLGIVLFTLYAIFRKRHEEKDINITTNEISSKNQEDDRE